MRNFFNVYNADEFIQLGILNEKCKQEDWYISGLIECGEMATDYELDEYNCFKFKDYSDKEYREDDETVYILVLNKYFDKELRYQDFRGAFNTYAEAACFLRKVKADFKEDPNYKCYSGNGYLRIKNRINPKWEIRYFIKDVDFVK